MKRSLINKRNKRWLKVGLASSVLAGTGGLAMAQIALVDGSLTTGMVGEANGAGGNSISDSFTVSTGMNVDALVVGVYDRNQSLSGNGSGGSTGGLDPLSLAWGSQTIGRVVYQNNLSSHYGDSIIYVLYNPNPGTQTITFTDTTTQTPSDLSMQIYDLSGVDTTVAPAVFSVGNANIDPTHMLPLNVSATTAGAWASLVASAGDSGSGFPTSDTYSTTSGTVAYQWLVENQSAIMGAVQGLAAGSTTVTFNDASTSSVQSGFAAAVFEPIPEPSSLALIGLGTLAFGFVSRFRKNS
jgi:hypothetical protein